MEACSEQTYLYSEACFRADMNYVIRHWDLGVSHRYPIPSSDPMNTTGPVGCSTAIFILEPMNTRFRGISHDDNYPTRFASFALLTV